MLKYIFYFPEFLTFEREFRTPDDVSCDLGHITYQITPYLNFIGSTLRQVRHDNERHQDKNIRTILTDITDGN